MLPVYLSAQVTVSRRPHHHLHDPPAERSTLRDVRPLVHARRGAVRLPGLYAAACAVPKQAGTRVSKLPQPRFLRLVLDLTVA